MSETSGFLRELSVIVLAVLIALGVDAAWEVRQEKFQELQHLEALGDDFEANNRRLAGTITDFNLTMGAAQEILMVVQGLSSPTPDSLLALIRTMGNGYRFEPQTAALQDLTTSGGLRILRDAELRRELSAFLAILDRLRTRSTTFNDLWRDALVVDQLELLDLSDLSVSDAPRVRATDWTDVVHSRAFRNLATRRVTYAEGTIRDHEAALAIVERVQRLLKAGAG